MLHDTAVVQTWSAQSAQFVGRVLTSSSELKLLSYIDKLCKKIASAVGAIKRVKPFVPQYLQLTSSTSL